MAKAQAKAPDKKSNKASGTQRVDMYRPSFTQLRINPEFNIREDYGDLEWLAENIKENGVKRALVGTREGEIFHITDGFRRYKALELLYTRHKLDIKVPFQLEPRSYNNEQRTLDMFLHNEGGVPLTPLEQAEGITRLIAYGWEPKEIAQKLSKTESYISRLLVLKKAPMKAINLIKKGLVAAATVIDLTTTGEINKFVEDYEQGEYIKPEEKNLFSIQQAKDATQAPTPEQTASPAPSSKKKDNKPKPVSKADINKKKNKEAAAAAGPNSWKSLKGIITGMDKNPKFKDPAKSKVFVFCLKIMNNEMTEEQIKAYFK